MVYISKFTCVDITVNQSDHLPGTFMGRFFLEETCNLCKKYEKRTQIAMHRKLEQFIS